ncbi:BCCT family transporter [Actinomycetospora sp. NBRC 106378]|uniref:BCCT family transporter n=1 Tax=Actinomycetospora sp. NBRC 106378 TaxID=3032208 RepID=UPI0024A4CA25|nr:BCCT family transporter [Actinomycetospora sp. NBRC 106378]GLZ53444.1 choline transporter [Actinomycetospora sp. NBRC 106378]
MTTTDSGGSGSGTEGGSTLTRYLRTHTNPPVFLVSGIVVLAFLAAGVIFPDGTSGVFSALLDGISRYFGWFYILAATGFLAFALYLMVSKYGRIKLGPDDASPEYGTTAWFAMLFTAGMGIGLVFYGVYEPAYHAMNPPTGPAGTPEAAERGMNYTFYHWGFHPWAIYIVLGLAMGYFCFRKGLPMRPASALYPLLGQRVFRWPGAVVDILAVFGTLFGLATSLGLGSQQIGSGLNQLTGLPNTTTTQVLVVCAITAVAVVSVMLGVDKGIRRLSLVNLWLAFALMVFVFAVGPKMFVLTGLADWTGYYLQNIIGTSFTVFNPDTQPAAFDWQASWTLFYWGWWMSWAPFVGMFIARISYGRTVRQFVSGALLAPVGASIVWFSVLGGTGLAQQLSGQADIAGGSSESSLFTVLSTLSVGGVVSAIASVLAIIVVVLFFATSSDSGSLVVDMLTNGGDPHPIWQQRLFWALMEGAVTIVLLLVGGAAALDALQAASITTGLPFAVVLILMALGVLKALRSDPAVTGGGPVVLSDTEGGGYRPGADRGAAAEETAAPATAEPGTAETGGGPKHAADESREDGAERPVTGSAQA